MLKSFSHSYISGEHTTFILSQYIIHTNKGENIFNLTLQVKEAAAYNATCAEQYNGTIYLLYYKKQSSKHARMAYNIPLPDECIRQTSPVKRAPLP